MCSNVGLVAVPSDLVDALILPDEVVDVALGICEMHFIHAKSLISVEEELSREGRAKQNLALSQEVFHVRVDLEESNFRWEGSWTGKFCRRKLWIRVQRIGSKPC